MACFSHWWTTTSSVAGSTSATRASPRVEEVDGLGHHRQRVGVVRHRARRSGPTAAFDLGLEVCHGQTLAAGSPPSRCR